jgi:DNA polymerase-3 subunit delta'
VSTGIQSLLIHPRTRLQVDSYLSRPAHALLITGVAGSGKGTLARAVAAELLALESVEVLANYPYFTELSVPAGKQEIPIELIRQLIKDFRLKTPGKDTIRRVVLLKNANLMSLEAQNALLKILEEPSEDAVFILTAVNKNSLLPTIVSRTRRLYVQPITLEDANTYYRSQKSEAEVRSSWLLSGGAIGLMQALLHEEDHQLKAAVDQAKSWIRSSPYQRQLGLDKLVQNRQEMKLFLDGLSRLLGALQRQYLEKDQLSQSKKITASRSLVNQIQDGLEANIAPKLAAQFLLLNLKV